MNKPTITLKRADDTSALISFYCGVKSMDDFIHDRAEGLEKHIRLHLSNLWLVYEENEVVAFFALSKDALVLNNEDRKNVDEANRKSGTQLAEEDDEYFWGSDKFSAIEIDYLAVCEDKRTARGDHLGTLLINIISQKAMADALSSTLFLTVEALDSAEYSAVDFYKSCGFNFSDKALNQYRYEVTMNGHRPLTRRMYKPLVPFE